MSKAKTDQTSVLQKKLQPFVYRGEEFLIIYHSYIDTETGETYTTTELDELNLVQVHNQYRSRHGIPFVDEIKAIREQYGLSPAKMSEILDFGTNGYKNYENGEMPSAPHGRYIQLIRDPKQFERVIELSKNKLEPDEWEKIIKKVRHSVASINITQQWEETFLFGSCIPDEFTGFRKPEIKKIGAMVAFFSKAVKPFTTKMNKLLFYSDFLHYGKTGYSISGLSYVAITHGPVPKKYGTIYSALNEKGYIDITYVDFGNGIEGEQFVQRSEPDLNIFTESELKVLREVMASIGKVGTKAIVEISHEEIAWKHNAKDKSPINYRYGFALKQV